ncbi:MAG: lipopolysaccharide biosynthesis protein [Bacteroidota bacterium]
MNNPLRKLVGQTAIYGLSSIVGRLLNYLLVPLYTYKFANAADYGVVSELYAWVAFLVVLLSFGMETTYFRFSKETENEKEVFNCGFLTLLVVNLSFLLFIFILHQPIANAMLFNDHPEYIILLSLIVVLDGLSVLPLARLRAKEKAMKFAAINFTAIIVNISLNLFFLLVLFDPANPEQGILYILLANLIASALKPIILIKDFFKIHFNPDWSLIRRMLLFSSPLVLAGFAGIINETLDRILLKQILYNPSNPDSLKIAEAQVGIYSACYKLAMLVTIIIQAFRYAAEPFFFTHQDNEKKNQIYVRIMNYFFGFLCLIFLGVTMNIDVLKYFIQNETYWEGLGVVPILLIANIFLGVYYNQSIWYKLSDKTKFGAIIAFSGAILTILINLLFIPKYGYWASAWATLIAYGFQMIFSYILGQRYYPIPYNIGKLSIYFGGCFIFYFTFSKINFEVQFLNYLFKNSSLILFAFFFLVIEKFWKEKQS